MKIANIYPIANQANYKDEEYVMILAHLIDRYNPENFNENQYIIMDNGLFEKAQVSTNLQDVIDLAENSGIPVNEIIIPDAVNNSLETIKLFEQAIPVIKEWQWKYRFMFVAQANNYDELSKMFNYINQYEGELNLSIGVSKLTPLHRDSAAAIEIYKTSKFPIHFLGIKTTFKELINVRKYIRGCDTSQLAFMAKNKVNISRLTLKGNAVINYQRYGIDIDLAVDNCDENQLNILKKKLKEEQVLYGLL